MKLYSHNKIAYDKLVTNLETNNKACIVQPTGTGKSFIVAELLKNNSDKNFLILTSTNYIISQFVTKFSYSNYEYITYSTLITERFKEFLNKSYDYIILDEFHRGGASEWGFKLNELISVHETAKVIGLTATHIRYLEDNRNMADELFDGNLVHNLSIMECFDKGILPRPKYISAIYNLDDEYSRLLDKIDKSKSSNKVQLRKRLIEYKAQWEYSNGADVILKKHIQKEKNFIVFCRNIEHLEKMIPTVKNWFKSFELPINIFKVYSTHLESENELDNFKESSKINKNEFNLLFSVQQLNEGIHVPNIEGVLFLRPTESPTIYFQQLGRCLETKGNRPIVFDMVNNFKKSTVHSNSMNLEYEPQIRGEYLSTDYNQFVFSFEILDEVKEIQELFNDIEYNISNFISRYETIKALLENNHPLNRSQKAWLQNIRKLYQNKKLSDNQIQLLDELIPLLGYDWKKKQNESFEDRYSIIKALLENNHPLNQSQETWLIYQRTLFNKQKKLSDNQIQLLDELIPLLGYDWKEKQIKSFENRYSIIKALLENNHPLNQSQKAWLQNIRKLYQNKKLSDNQIQLLDELILLLGYDWKEKQIKSFEDIYSIIKALLENNHPLNQSQKGWLISQRTLFNKQKLSDNQIQLLDELIPLLGYDWKKKKKESFENRYSIIKALLENNHPLNQSQKLWIKTQRDRKQKLSDNQIQLLDELIPLLGYDWKEKQIKSFEDRYSIIKTQLENNKPLNKSQKGWLQNIRKLYQNKKLSDNQIQLLDELIPLLGYDWKISKKNSRKKQT